MDETVKVACVQAESVAFDRAATIDKVDALAAEVVGNGARLALFPEAFIPAYPSSRWARHLAGWDGDARPLYARLARESIEIPSADADRLGEIARRHGLWLAVGANELERGTIYNSLLIYSPAGELALHHRKLMPTNHERLVWGLGDGKGLQAVATGLGNVGGLICWENLMPLARFALYESGVEIYLAPTADDSEDWHDSIRHIARVACVRPQLLRLPARVELSGDRAARGGRRAAGEGRFRDPGARRDVSRRAALGRGGRSLCRPRPGAPLRGAPEVRSGRSLPPAGRVPLGGRSLGTEDAQSQLPGREVAQLALEVCRRHVFSFPQGGSYYATSHCRPREPSVPSLVHVAWRAERRSTRSSPIRRVTPSASNRSSSSWAVFREVPRRSRKLASVIRPAAPTSSTRALRASSYAWVETA